MSFYNVFCKIRRSDLSRIERAATLVATRQIDGVCLPGICACDGRSDLTCCRMLQQLPLQGWPDVNVNNWCAEYVIALSRRSMGEECQVYVDDGSSLNHSLVGTEDWNKLLVEHSLAKPLVADMNVEDLTGYLAQLLDAARRLIGRFESEDEEGALSEIIGLFEDVKRNPQDYAIILTSE